MKKRALSSSSCDCTFFSSSIVIAYPAQVVFVAIHSLMLPRMLSFDRHHHFLFLFLFLLLHLRSRREPYQGVRLSLIHI